MHRDYSYAVIIGRFQPLHNSHVKLIEQALEIADKVLILVGSSYAARTPKNPFTFDERKNMIQKTFPETEACSRDDMAHVRETHGATGNLGQARRSTQYCGRISVEPIRDYFYSDDVWLANVQGICSNYIEDGETVALLGTYKDASSYYLNLFPQWEYVSPEAGVTMHASDVRDKLFDAFDLCPCGSSELGEHPRTRLSTTWDDASIAGKPVLSSEVKEMQDKWFTTNLPIHVIKFLQDFRGTPEFALIADEFKANREYKQSWDESPFPPVFVTADAVVTCAGHVLVIKRGGNPGKGLLALPGGFVRPNERVKFAALRELKEETRIKVDKLILESSIVDKEVFDYPDRSLRGRTITHAFHVKLKSGNKLPEVKGGDDAKGAFWMPMMEVMRRADEFFEDHIHIINRFINK